MAAQFGLEELEQVLQEMPVGKKEARVIKLICAVTKTPLLVVTQAKTAIESYQKAVADLVVSVTKVLDQDAHDEVDTKKNLEQVAVARKRRKAENKAKVVVANSGRKDAEDTIKRLENYLAKFV
jgi:hypothetical protein